MSNRQRIMAISAIIVLLLLAIVVPQTLFTVDERQLAVVVRFGEPVAVYGEKDTGLHVKTPFIDKVRYLPRTYQFWSGAEGEILENLPTADGNKLEITPWAIWRITDAEQFVRTMVTVEAGEHRVKEYVRSGVRDEITRNDLSEVVRSDTQRVLKYPIQAALPAITDEPGDRPAEDNGVTSKSPGQERRAEKIRIGRKKIVELIDEAVARRLLLADEKDGQSSRGIELVDLGIAKVDFVDTVREAAFNRLIAFWESIAARYTYEGERFKTEIINRTNAEVQRIEGEGKEQANTIRGEVDAKIIEIYAVAIEKTGEFYNFIRILEAYEAALGSNTRLILTTNSELFRLLKEVQPSTVPTETTPD